MKLATRVLRTTMNQFGYELIPLPKTCRKPRIQITVEEIANDRVREANPINDELFSWKLLHASNPYEGFDHEEHPKDARGWGKHSELFEKLILRTRPTLLLEVGSWKGASALDMADILDRHQIDCTIVCIDTWLGALEFWTDQSDRECFGSLGLRNGYPTVYYQFLANVKRANHHRRIVPFPQTSAIAGHWFRLTGFKAQLIYVDASHSEEDVYRDLVAYSQCLDENGAIFGDDYRWEGVKLAVDRFAAENGQFICEVEDGQWCFQTVNNAVS